MSIRVQPDDIDGKSDTTSNELFFEIHRNMTKCPQRNQFHDGDQKKEYQDQFQTNLPDKEEKHIV